MARTLIHSAYRKNTRPDVAFIAEATGLTETAVSDLAAMAAPLTPDLPTPSSVAPPSPTVEGPSGGQIGAHHITAMHDVRYGTDTIVLVGCVCGVMLRAGVKELPRHWRRHTEGLL